jgi:preprotein translocase subunit SecD
MAAAAAEPLLVEIAAMKASRDQRTGQAVVTITLNERDRAALARLTTDNIGRVMEIRLEGKVLARPVIREPILGGIFQISGAEVDKIGAVVDRVATDRPKLELEIEPD